MNTTNPFPGMNPFMEQTWPDVHLRLIGLALETLGIELPEDLVAKAELQVDVFESPHDKSRPIRPDLAIVDVAQSWVHGLPPVWTPGSDAGAITVTEPALLMLSEVPHRWIEIRTDLGDLVTVIEVLSPANKFAHREAYRLKRQDYVAARVNVVEIDLLREGGFTVDVDETSYEQQYGPLGERYTLCASRGIIPGRREVYTVRCASGCQPSASRCAPPIPMYRSTFRRSSIAATPRADIGSSITSANSGRRFPRRTPHGSASGSSQRVSAPDFFQILTASPRACG